METTHNTESKMSNETTMIAVLNDSPNHGAVLAVGADDIRERWDELSDRSDWTLYQAEGSPSEGDRIRTTGLAEVQTDTLWA